MAEIEELFKPFAPDLDNTSVGKWSHDWSISILFFYAFCLVEQGLPSYLEGSLFAFFSMLAAKEAEDNLTALELHMISDGRRDLDFYADIMPHIHPYMTAFHLREPKRSASELWQVVLAMLARGVPAGKIIVNDRIDVAWAAKLQGAQLSYRSLGVRETKAAFPGLRLGCSVHERGEAMLAEQQGADFLLYGHVFATASKPGQEPKGIPGLEQVARSVAIPVIAIGGISPAHVREIAAAGAAGVAVLSGITRAADPLLAARQYAEALNTVRRHEG